MTDSFVFHTHLFLIVLAMCDEHFLLLLCSFADANCPQLRANQILRQNIPSIHNL